MFLTADSTFFCQLAYVDESDIQKKRKYIEVKYMMQSTLIIQVCLKGGR